MSFEPQLNCQTRNQNPTSQKLVLKMSVHAKPCSLLFAYDVLLLALKTDFDLKTNQPHQVTQFFNK